MPSSSSPRSTCSRGSTHQNRVLTPSSTSKPGQQLPRRPQRPNAFAGSVPASSSSLASDSGPGDDADLGNNPRLLLNVIRRVFSDEPALAAHLEESIPRLFTSRQSLISNSEIVNLTSGIEQQHIRRHTNSAGSTSQSASGGSSSQSPSNSNRPTSSGKRTDAPGRKGKGREGEHGNKRKRSPSGTGDQSPEGRLKCAFWDAYPDIVNQQVFENCAPPLEDGKKFQDRNALL